MNDLATCKAAELEPPTAKCESEGPWGPDHSLKQTIRRIIKQRGKATGAEGEVSGHSLRRGGDAGRDAAGWSVATFPDAGSPCTFGTGHQGTVSAPLSRWGRRGYSIREQEG